MTSTIVLTLYLVAAPPMSLYTFHDINECNDTGNYLKSRNQSADINFKCTKLVFDKKEQKWLPKN